MCWNMRVSFSLRIHHGCQLDRPVNVWRIHCYLPGVNESSMLGASLSAPHCREGGREGERERERDLTSLFFLSLHAGAGKHMSPLHSGQEDKRGRKGGIGIWERRR